MPIAMKKEELDLYIRVYDKVEENLKELREEIIFVKSKVFLLTISVY